MVCYQSHYYIGAGDITVSLYFDIFLTMLLLQSAFV